MTSRPRRAFYSRKHMQAPVLTPEAEKRFLAEREQPPTQEAAGVFPSLPVETRVLAKSLRAFMSLGRCLQHLESRSGLLEQGDKDLLDRNMLMALQMADAITRVIGLDADR